MREDLRTHVVLHLGAHDMAYVSNIEIRKELHHHKSHKNDTKIDDAFFRAFLHINNV